MAFKKTAPPAFVPDTPLRLFQDHLQGKVDNLWPHQTAILKSYAEKALCTSDVAFQLPTGSGKTLVGLLIAEWCRRKHNERAVFLCPTRQLVHQVASQAREKYGLNVVPFTGPKSEYSGPARDAYVSGAAVGITTYSSLFNSNPFFDDAGLLILDDAHAAENYIAALWSIRIHREGHPVLHSALSGILRQVVEPGCFSRLAGETATGADSDWVDKLPTEALTRIEDEIRDVMDEHTRDSDLKFPWSMIRDHLQACHLYLSPTEILIRPLIPPTWTHAPFDLPRQRVYMSATLGEGGDLERVTGRPKILRLTLPEGVDAQGIGRRFFIFPDLSLDSDDSIVLRRNMMRHAGRSLLLVPNGNAEQEAANDIRTNLGFPTFSARDIELSKQQFISTADAAVVAAGRYDGIDFPGDECRLLILDGLPKAANAQERFLMSKMGATILYNERIRTRVVQAIGRCTRSAKDHAAVVVTGEHLTRYLTDQKRIRHLVPEMQAELLFGASQSRTTTSQDLEDNLQIFLEHGEEWAQVNNDIVRMRESLTQEPLPAIGELGDAAPREIDYQKAIWKGDYAEALGHAESVLGILRHDDLRGYRALWHYLAGSAACLAELEVKARDHYLQAKKAAYGITWLVTLGAQKVDQAEKQNLSDENRTLLAQVEGLESFLSKVGTNNDRGFVKFEKAVLEGLAKPNTFENAHRLLGELLGCAAGKVESDGSPDPWWIAGDICLVFEDHAGAKPESALDVTKARQVRSHPDWMRANVPACASPHMEITPVILTPVSKVKEGATPHLDPVALWSLEDFREWAGTAISIVRELRSTFQEQGNLLWRLHAMETLERAGLDMPGLAKRLKENSAKTKLTPVP